MQKVHGPLVAEVLPILKYVGCTCMHREAIVLKINIYSLCMAEVGLGMPPKTRDYGP